MIANVIILLLVFGYCGLVIYWKRTGVLKDSCSSCGAETAAAGGGAVAAAALQQLRQCPCTSYGTAIRQLRNIDPVRCLPSAGRTAHVT